MLVLVIVVAGAFYVTIPMVASSSSTTTTPETTSTTSSNASTPTGSSGKLTMNVQQPLIVAPDVNVTATMKFSSIGTVSGAYSLSATSLPKGVTVSFQPSTVNFPGQLSGAVTLTLSASNGAAVSNSTISVQATSGSSVYTQQFSLQSVQALVLIQGNAFVPNSLSVAAGTKVYWLNLDSSAAGDVAAVTHDVTALDGSFSSGTGSLQQYSIYGHTFATAGTVKYDSAAQGSSVSGQVVVT
ncbi:MAG: hypothetical protein OK455_03280 [Thaumarchaeota archaeon]|nr:hypothetical protein [Nitrososphaerota archaeon]